MCLQPSGLSSHSWSHTPSIAFWNLPPNSARFSYATEGAFFISAQLSTNAVSTLQKVWVLIRLRKHACKHDASIPGKKKKKFCLNWNDSGFIWAGVSNMVSYKTNVWYNLSCLQQTYYCLNTNKKLLISWQFFGPYGVTKYGSGWRKDVVNQCLESELMQW